MSEKIETRQLETTIEIDAPIEDVWQTISESEGVTRWFAPEAKIEPGVGGSYFVSWGPGMEGTQRISIWEPNKQLRTEEERVLPYSCGGEEQGTPLATPTLIAVDFILESRDGKTVLRLVHSGFAATSDWDGEYESTKYGWGMFLNNLKFGLENHPGERARQVSINAISALSAEESWARLMGAEGMVAAGSLSDLSPGDNYSITMANGEALQGEVHKFRTGYFGGSVSNLNSALLGVYCEPMQGMVFVVVSLILFGDAITRAEGIRNSWTALLQELFPAPAEMAAPAA